MMLVDATKDNRFLEVTAAINDLVYGDETSLMINRLVGQGVVTYTTEALETLAAAAKFRFPVTTIRLNNILDADEAVEIAQRAGGVVIVDEAEELDRIEGLADALRALESPYIKFVYVALVREAGSSLSASEVVTA